MEKSKGKERVRLSFNPNKESIVDQIKEKSAELIDLLEAIKSSTPDSKVGSSPEILRLIALA